MNESKVRGLKWNLKKVRWSILHFSLIIIYTFINYINFTNTSGPKKQKQKITWIDTCSDSPDIDTLGLVLVSLLIQPSISDELFLSFSKINFCPLLVDPYQAGLFLTHPYPTLCTFWLWLISTDQPLLLFYRWLGNSTLVL